MAQCHYKFPESQKVFADYFQLKIMFPWFFDKWSGIIPQYIVFAFFMWSSTIVLKRRKDKKKPFTLLITHTYKYVLRHVRKIFCMFDSHSYINIFMLKGTFKFFGKLIRFDNQVTGLYFTKTVCHYLRFLKLTNEKLQMYEDFTCNFYGRIPKGLNCYFSIQLLFKL